MRFGAKIGAAAALAVAAWPAGASGLDAGAAAGASPSLLRAPAERHVPVPRLAFRPDDPAPVVAQPEPAGPEPGEDATGDAAAGPEEPPKPSLLRSLISDWKGELKFGFELASGNNDRTRFRGGFDINKGYWGHRTRLRSEYIIAQDNRGESENRLFSEVRQNWATGGTNWSGVFLRAAGRYDRFQDFDYRLSISGGANYELYKSEKASARAEIGLNARRDFGGRNDDWVPEGALFLEGEYRISDRQKVSAEVDYFPEIEQPSRYRLNARGNWDIDIDPEAGLGLRLSVNNRYDARPRRSPERNDFDMAVYLIWNF